jgi:hypothetical protein
MNNLNLIRGLFVIAVAAAFGLSSTRYDIGHFSHPDTGFFPLMVSCILFIVGVAIVIRSRMTEAEPAFYTLRNIALILVSLIGFGFLAKHVNLIAGILFLVFVSSAAGEHFSVSRSLKISVVLAGIALAFHKLLGLNLPLY